MATALQQLANDLNISLSEAADTELDFLKDDIRAIEEGRVPGSRMELRILRLKRQHCAILRDLCDQPKPRLP